MKKTINLQHTGTEYINSKGERALADFRETDTMEDFIRGEQMNSSKPPEAEKVVRVFRVSKLGERLLARFTGSTALQDAEKVAAKLQKKYNVYGFYSTLIK